jgi:CheY-like chemotaxis protein
MKILLIEDDLVDQMAIKRLFKKNYLSNRLEVVENGLEALAFLREHNSQSLASCPEHLLILLDLYLPKMNGLEFLTHLQSDSNLKKLPVIVLITSEEEKYQRETDHLNIVGYLRKPFTFSEFTQLMRTLNKNKVFEPIPQAI